MLGDLVLASSSGPAWETLGVSISAVNQLTSTLVVMAEISLPPFRAVEQFSLLAIVPSVTLFFAWYLIGRSAKRSPVSSSYSRQRVLVSTLLLIALSSLTAYAVGKWQQNQLLPAPFGGIHHQADLRYLTDIHERLSQSIKNFYEWQSKHPDGDSETVQERLEVALNLRTNSIDWIRQFIAQSSNDRESEEAIESVLFEMTPHRLNQASALRFAGREQSRIDQDSAQIRSQIAILELQATESKKQLDTIPKSDANRDQRTAVMNTRIAAEEQLAKLRERIKQIDSRRTYLQSFYGPMLQSATPEKAPLPRGHVLEQPWLKLPVVASRGVWFGWVRLIATSLLLLHLLLAIGFVLAMGRSSDSTIRLRDEQFLKRFILGLAIGSTAIMLWPYVANF